MQIILYLIIGVAIGMSFPIQASLNVRLSFHAKTPLTASFIAFLSGLIILLILNLIIDPAGISTRIDFSYPLYVFIGGGIAGLSFNVINIVLFAKLGASMTTLLTIAGQMIVGILIDHFGWFGVPPQIMSATRVLGGIVMIFAIFLAQFNKKNDMAVTSSSVKKQDGKFIWGIVGVLAGFLAPLQTAINGKLSVATGSFLGSAFISFFVGTVLLAVLLLITQRGIEIPRYDKHTQQRIPLWTYIGGVCSVLIVTGNIILLPVLGSILTVMIFLLGQMIMAILVDQFGLFSLQKRKIDARKIITIVLMIIGIILVKF